MKALWRSSVVVLALALAACQNQKAPAEAALKSAQDAFDAVSVDAQKYVPDQAKPIQDALTAAKDAAAKGDYAAVLTRAQPLPAQISALSNAITSKKAELTAAWPAMAAAVPQLVKALKSRVDMLSASKRLPADLTAETVSNAKAGVASATQLWTEATTAAQAGDVATASAKGTEVRVKVLDLMKSLKMQLPKGAS